MSDNVTTNAIINFIWSNPIIAAVLGAVIALIGREIIEWYKRPRLKIKFIESKDHKPSIIDYTDWQNTTADTEYRIKYLRLIVSNKGKRPATDCEVKLEQISKIERCCYEKIPLRWARRDPKFYQDLLYSKYNKVELTNPEKLYLPINLNIKDEETVDVLILPYHFSTVKDTDHSYQFDSMIEIASLNKPGLISNAEHYFKLTAYSSNTIPVSLEFKVIWDGTLKGFHKAVSYTKGA